MSLELEQWVKLFVYFVSSGGEVYKTWPHLLSIKRAPTE